MMVWDMILGMTGMEMEKDVLAQELCRACGFCCNGYLFIWAKLRPAELAPAEALGLQVFRSDPAQRGFSQPCPLWKGECSIYTSIHYPKVCRAYKCKLLKNILADTTSFETALEVVEQTKKMVLDLKELLPPSDNQNFRERLVEQLEHPQHEAWEDATYAYFRLKADALLCIYDEVFGVTDLFE